MKYFLIVGLWFTVTLTAGDWHRATRAECARETDRELISMGRAGIIGDPPISNGFSFSTLPLDGTVGTGYSLNPCGYTDGVDFKPIYTISGPRGVCVITEKQEAWLYKIKGRLSRHRYREFSQKRLEKMLAACKAIPAEEYYRGVE